MRYGIFSDIHSNLEALAAVIEAYKREAIDRYLCIGDVVGYAANPKECVEKVKTIASVTIAGNHDWAAVNLFAVDYFSPSAREAINWTTRNLDDNSRCFLESLNLIYKNEDLTLVHGTLDNPGDFNYMTDGYIAEESFRLMETTVCFVGHTHVTGTFIKDKDGKIYYLNEDFNNIKPGNKYIVNVGSVGQPRDGNSQAAYSIYDTEKKAVWIKRIVYDIEVASRKIYAAGLPEFLGQRLILGR